MYYAVNVFAGTDINYVNLESRAKKSCRNKTKNSYESARGTVLYLFTNRRAYNVF